MGIMLRVEQLRLKLPAGFEHRAGGIARLVGEGLTTIPTKHSVTLDRLSVGPVRIGENFTDLQIAQHIVKSITTTIRGAQ